MLNIVSNLDTAKFEANILTLSPEPEDSMRSDFENLGIKIYALEMGRIEGVLKGKKVFRQLLKEIGPDLIHSQGLRPDALCSGWRKTPVVNTLRMDPGMDYPMKFGKVLGALMKFKHLATVKKSRSAVACSQSIQELFAKKYNLKLACIENGVDTIAFQEASESSKSQLRKKFKIDSKAKVFIVVGSLIPRKDNATLIRAFLQQNNNAILLLVGEGSEMEKLQHLANNAKNIKFLGQLNNVKDYLHLSDFFVSASLSEGLPNTVLEAMACALPVVLSEIPPHREIFSASDYPYFFPCGDVGALSQKMKLIGQTEQRGLKGQMKDLACNVYSAKRMSGRYQELYMKLLS
jgi:glycosyltransferase involved in cell wall biosynthesis